MEIEGLKKISNVTFKDALAMLHKYLTNPKLKYAWFIMSYEDGRVCRADNLEEILNNWNRLDWDNSSGFEVSFNSASDKNKFKRLSIKYNFPSDASRSTGEILRVIS